MIVEMSVAVSVAVVSSVFFVGNDRLATLVRPDQSAVSDVAVGAKSSR